MVSVESQDPWEPQWYIFQRQEDKVSPGTGLVSGGFDDAE